MGAFRSSGAMRTEAEMAHSLKSMVPALSAWAGLGNGPLMLSRVPGFDRRHVRFSQSIADLQNMAVAELLQSLNSVRGPMERLGIILDPYRVSPCSSAHWKRT